MGCTGLVVNLCMWVLKMAWGWWKSWTWVWVQVGQGPVDCPTQQPWGGVVQNEDVIHRTRVLVVWRRVKRCIL